MDRAANDVAGVPRARRAEPADAPAVVQAYAGPELSTGEELSDREDLPGPGATASGAAARGAVGVAAAGVAAPDTPAAGVAASQAAEPDRLTAGERDLLDFEKQWWRRAGAKEQAIRDRFDLSATRYYQQLNALLERPAALAYDPVLVTRLRRLRTSRRRPSGHAT